MQAWLKSTFGAAVMAAALVAPAHADLVLDLTSGGTPNACGSCSGGVTYGWAFTVRNAITIDGLGMWDFGADGLGQPAVQIGVWSSAGTLLASTTVTDASTRVASANSAGDWLFESIATLTLASGSYRIGALFNQTTPIAQTSSPYTTISDVTVTGGVAANGTGFRDPTSSFTIPIFGPTMHLADAAPLPEPASFALVGVALLGVGAASRRRAR
ncbi:PEP-CTERM sorting domain-containing protein [Roseateles sp.]|uniref:PEP-CTERM sorting domain-containing protein n=1 Tax=Roseateles sp. TaxID=1971397 RepID=UPI003BAB2DA1